MKYTKGTRLVIPKGYSNIVNVHVLEDSIVELNYIRSHSSNFYLIEGEMRYKTGSKINSHNSISIGSRYLDLLTKTTDIYEIY